MREQAEALLEQLMPAEDSAAPSALALFDPGFHEGVVGIVAGRLKDRLHRPTFVFARGGDGLLKGSGRSIPGFHLRDALDLVAKRHPRRAAALRRPCDGGRLHASPKNDFGDLRPALQQVAARMAGRRHADAHAAHRRPAGRWSGSTPQTVALLDAQVWGQGFEAPLFCDEVEVLQQRLVGEKHLKLRVRHAGALRDAIWFGHTEPVAARVRLAYRLSLDEWQGQQRVQMVVEAQG